MNQKDAPNGPDIVFFGSLGLNLVLVTDSTLIAEPGPPFSPAAGWRNELNNPVFLLP